MRVMFLVQDSSTIVQPSQGVLLTQSDASTTLFKSAWYARRKHRAEPAVVQDVPAAQGPRFLGAPNFKDLYTNMISFQPIST
jgi:hypothetical protein